MAELPDFPPIPEFPRLPHVSKFRFYVQSSLPALYEDELSYYEVLAKMRKKIEELIEIYSSLEEYFAQLHEMLTIVIDSMTQFWNIFQDIPDRVNILETDVSILQTQVSELQSFTTDLNGRLTTAEGNITTIFGDITNINLTIDDIIDVQNDLSSRVVVLEAAKVDIYIQLSLINQQISQQWQDFLASQAVQNQQITQNTTNISNIQAHDTAQDLLLQSHQSQIDSLDTEVIDIKNVNTSQDTQILLLQDRVGTLQTDKADKNQFTSVLTSISNTQASNKYTLNYNVFNAVTGSNTILELILPIVDTVNQGIATPDIIRNMVQMMDDIYALQQQGGRYIGESFATYADLAAFTPPPGTNIGDFTYVLDDENHNDVTTRYIYDGTTFQFAYIINYDPIEIASDLVAGIIKTGTSDGDVAVDLNGKAYVRGYQNLTGDITNILTLITTLDQTTWKKGQPPTILTHITKTISSQKVTLNIRVMDGVNGGTDEFPIDLMPVTDTLAGVMTPQMLDDLNSLKYTGGIFRGFVFATKAEFNTYIPTSEDKLDDFVYILHDETYNNSLSFYSFDGSSYIYRWHIEYPTPYQPPITIVTGYTSASMSPSQTIGTIQRVPGNGGATTNINVNIPVASDTQNGIISAATSVRMANLGNGIVTSYTPTQTSGTKIGTINNKNLTTGATTTTDVYSPTPPTPVTLPGTILTNLTQATQSYTIHNTITTTNTNTQTNSTQVFATPRKFIYDINQGYTSGLSLGTYYTETLGADGTVTNTTRSYYVPYASSSSPGVITSEQFGRIPTQKFVTTTTRQYWDLYINRNLVTPTGYTQNLQVKLDSDNKVIGFTGSLVIRHVINFGNTGNEQEVQLIVNNLYSDTYAPMGNLHAEYFYYGAESQFSYLYSGYCRGYGSPNETNCRIMLINPNTNRSRLMYLNDSWLPRNDFNQFTLWISF